MLIFCLDLKILEKTYFMFKCLKKCHQFFLLKFMKFDNFSGCRNISKTEIENPDFISKWLKYEGCEKTLQKLTKTHLISMSCHAVKKCNDYAHHVHYNLHRPWSNTICKLDLIEDIFPIC